MKIYIVQYDDYSSQDIEGVFSTEQKAMKFRANCGYPTDIEVWEIDGDRIDD